MNATSGHTVTDYERHKLEMLLWQADIHEKNGEKQEAAKIRGWVADFLSEQSKVVRSVWRRLRKPGRATLETICSQNPVYTEATSPAMRTGMQQLSKSSSS